MHRVRVNKLETFGITRKTGAVFQLSRYSFFLLTRSCEAGFFGTSVKHRRENNDNVLSQRVNTKLEYIGTHSSRDRAS